ncbi:hypothetical protein [Modestobacter versicolor]|uniref:Uncharacterized protein n=1 Tax=Modestobacter versicolor TaxID=429133 RepID=A0A323V650_9ACTN|nr:hypothetical protein [Modestobacter versicolor]MBB3675686.1 hypothetical protein [Modestobacter versicolor]PZA19991.1 hypothetical protein DMO24_17780 [Modestobacter versicolor]
MTAPGPDWVEQARRFAAGLATEHPGLTDALGGLLGAARPAPAEQAGEQAGEQAAECRSCPLCAGLAALRGRRPDLLEALADVLAGAADALRTTAGTTTRTTPDGSDAGTGAPAPEPSTPPEETVPHPAPAPAVQRIDVA